MICSWTVPVNYLKMSQSLVLLTSKSLYIHVCCIIIYKCLHDVFCDIILIYLEKKPLVSNSKTVWIFTYSLFLHTTLEYT